MRPNQKLNLSLTREDMGLFGIPELRSHEGFYAMKDQAVLDSDKLIAESCSPNRSRKMVEVFDELSDTLCKVADLAEFIRIAHPRAAYTQAAENACVSISGIVEKLNTDRALYRALKHVSDTEDIFPTDAVDQHVAKLFLFDFEQCGIHLPEEERTQVVHLNDVILQLGQRFMAGAISPKSVPRDMMPENLRHLFSSDDAHQEYLLEEMLQSRHRLAVVCGFPTYAHRALKGSTAETPDTVQHFLSILATELKERSAHDLQIMKARKQEDYPNNKELWPWDVAHVSQALRRDWLNVSSSEFAPYLSLGSCMEGLNLLMKQLFDVSLVNVEVQPGEVWAQDVYKLAVVDNNEGLLGHIYCDFYERAGKPNQDCHFTIRGGKQLSDGTYQDPLVVLMLNFPMPVWSSPSLLTPAMLDNLYHEMGHAMHSMLARTKHQHVTGTRCATDFAEVPSILMEYFASDPRVVRTFARHFQTGEPMPEAMLARLCASKHLFAAAETQVQVFYSALDQRYHGAHPLGGTTTDILAETQQQFYAVPYVANTAWQLRFSHLVGYGAKYYSYLLSRAVASWIWHDHFRDDPFSRQAGDNYRRQCLAHGGGKPARQLVAQFLQRDVTATSLAFSLIHEIDSKKEQVDMAKR